MKKNVCDLREGDKIRLPSGNWIVGCLLPPFDPNTVRVTVTPEESIHAGAFNLENGEYTTFTFDTNVVLDLYTNLPVS